MRMIQVVILLFPCVSPAQSAQSAVQSSTVYPERHKIRDPFTPSMKMYDAVGRQSGNTAGVFGFVPNTEGMKVPGMKLRGLMNTRSGEFIALLEISGIGTYMVREGDEFNIDPAQPRNALRISKITRLSVTVETGMLGSIRVMR